MEHPSELRFETGPLEIEAADANGTKKTPTFSGVAYGGGPMAIKGWSHNVVVDLSGMGLVNHSIPIRLNHNPEMGVGHTTEVSMNGGKKMTVKGVISRATPHAQEVVDSAKSGFPWNASIGCSVGKNEFLGEGKTAEINGRVVTGPLNLIRKSTLSEISFVDLGADTTTSLNVAAKSALGEQMEATEQEVILKAERSRTESIIKAAKKFQCGKNLRAQAISEGWDLPKFELQAMRTDRAEITKKAPPAVIIAGDQDEKFTSTFLEASLTLHINGDAVVEKRFGAQVAEQVRCRRPRHILDIFASWADSTGIPYHNKSDLIQAAASSISMQTALESSIKKTLIDIYRATPNTCLQISKQVDSPDFRPQAVLRLSPQDASLQPTGPHGEVKTAFLGEQAWTVQNQTFAKGFSISRRDLINDNIGIMNSVPQSLSDGASRCLGDVFWRMVMSNPNNYFSVGNGNYASGAGSVFGSTSLYALVASFRNRKDVNGSNISMPPVTLVVPPTLEMPARAQLRSTLLQAYVAAGIPQSPQGNPLAQDSTGPGAIPGLEVEARLENPLFPGFSSTAFYCFSDREKAAFLISFLQGSHEPIIVTVPNSPDEIAGGISWQCLFDFSVAPADPLASYMSAGV